MVEQLHLILFGYYSTMSSSLNSTLNPSSIDSSRTADDILLAHLVYKSIVKMAVWVWNQLQRTGRDRVDNLQPWVSGRWFLY